MICELHGINSNVATHFCCTMLKQQYHSSKVLKRCAARTPIRATTPYTKLNLIACMWCVKRITLDASCPGGIGVLGCIAKKEVWERT